jgi:hypothetical protein
VRSAHALLQIHGAAQAYEALATTRAAAMPYPGYLQPVTDAAFGASFTRVTDPSRLRPLCVLRHATFDRTDTAYVFTTNGVQLQHWTEHHRPGHGDMTIDTDGSDVLLARASPDKYHIIKRRLDDGAVTDLAPYGDGQHASIHNINRPGWVFVT